MQKMTQKTGAAMIIVGLAVTAALLLVVLVLQSTREEEREPDRDALTFVWKEPVKDMVYDLAFEDREDPKLLSLRVSALAQKTVLASFHNGTHRTVQDFAGVPANLSSDGETVITLTADPQEIHVFDAKGHPYFSKAHKPFAFRGITAFSPDGDYVAIVEGEPDAQQLRVWQLHPLQQVFSKQLDFPVQEVAVAQKCQTILALARSAQGNQQCFLAEKKDEKFTERSLVLPMPDTLQHPQFLGSDILWTASHITWSKSQKEPIPHYTTRIVRSSLADPTKFHTVVDTKEGQAQAFLVSRRETMFALLLQGDPFQRLMVWTAKGASLGAAQCSGHRMCWSADERLLAVGGGSFLSVFSVDE